MCVPQFARCGLAKRLPVPRRSQIAINYHKLWDNLPALMAALGLPAELAASFPRRAETARRGIRARDDGRSSGVDSGVDSERELAETRSALRRLYAPLVDEIMANSAVMVV
jgi:hypothetical protein